MRKPPMTIRAEGVQRRIAHEREGLDIVLRIVVTLWATAIFGCLAFAAAAIWAACKLAGGA